ncbi:MAG: M20/M25/M40 family metallo-hydrolase [Acidobacteria bacterium]|nr:M20/M25/M40 family metallo-hydrolase [Acidobacteriota bacterium]
MKPYHHVSFIAILMVTGWLAAQPVRPHHQLQVSLDPESHRLDVTDRVTLTPPYPSDGIHFLLHGDLQVECLTEGLRLQTEAGELKSSFFGINTAEFHISDRIPVRHYSLHLPAGADPSTEQTVTLHYRGTIHHPVEQFSEEYARSFSETPGIIDPRGVYLSGSSFWIPWFNDDLISFRLTVDLPSVWDAVSQGERTRWETAAGRRLVTWDSPEPMDEAYLIAAPFTVYSQPVDGIQLMAYLRTPDETLAGKYLDTTGQYLRMYQDLIGPFPYPKFALVENFWETGYGMPSFTLLGPKIIRFPFILHSSYPHELLHNYWGNSVFVHYESGNWCEGLTVYLADHLIKEQRNQGVEYRRTTLQGYTDYVGANRDFPLVQFRARHDSASSAIGYGKSMMMFHMLRLRLGDERFIEGLRHFYRENRFRRADFGDLERSFSAVSGEDFVPFFRQWTTRTGAPRLELDDVRTEPAAGGFELVFRLRQTQPDEPFEVTIPLAVYQAGRQEPYVAQVDMTQREQSFRLPLTARPRRLEIDPLFDVFRWLHHSETPPSLSAAFGSPHIRIVLPRSAPEPLRREYEALARSWAGERSAQFEIVWDDDVKSLTGEGAIWLLGWENALRPLVEQQLAVYAGEISAAGVRLNQREFDPAQSIALVVRHPDQPRQPIVWLSTGEPAALAGLARKLPHYGKYSYLVFEGPEPSNTYKGQWPTIGSPLTADLTAEQPFAGEPFAALTGHEPLAMLPALFSAARMQQHIAFLADPAREGRGLGSRGLDESAAYIAEQFRLAGLQPGGDGGTFHQTWSAPVGREGATEKLTNIIGILPGTQEARHDQSIVLAAHYDHLGRGWPDVHQGDEGKIHPGADDNASGVAVLLELARYYARNVSPSRSVTFIAFTAEEPGRIGSEHFLEQLSPELRQGIHAMINLDSIGRLGDKKLLVLGGDSAREWKFIFMGIEYTTGVATELITQPLDASDQVSFIRRGIPGVQLFSGPHSDYHRPGDTMDKIDTAGLVRVATVAHEALNYLTERDEPLTFTGSTGAAPPARPAAAGRRAGTGVMPDFAFDGEGVKIAQVAGQSPAATAGLQPGDVIIRLGDTPVRNLQEYAAALKGHVPGETVSMIIRRNGSELTLSLTLAER